MIKFCEFKVVTACISDTTIKGSTRWEKISPPEELAKSISKGIDTNNSYHWVGGYIIPPLKLKAPWDDLLASEFTFVST